MKTFVVAIVWGIVGFIWFDIALKNKWNPRWWIPVCFVIGCIVGYLLS